MQVSTNALIGRVNRKLSAQGEVLRRCSERSRWFHDLGRYYIVSIYHNAIIAQHIDLEALAIELGALGSADSLAAG